MSEKLTSIYLLQENFIKFELKNMPTILQTRGYRFFFYINDHHPPHIHVEKERSTAKFFLKNAELARSKRFNASELNEIRKIILENIEFLKTKWNEHFTNY